MSKTGCFNSTSSKTYDLNKTWRKKYDFRLKMSESVRLNHGNFKKSMIWEQKMQNYDFMPETGYFTSKIAFSTRIYAIQNTFFERENVLFWLTLTLNGQKMNHLSAARLNFSFKKIILISKIILVIKGQSKTFARNQGQSSN